MSVNKTFNKLPIEPYEVKQHFGSSNHINKALSYEKKESYQLKGLKKINGVNYWIYILLKKIFEYLKKLYMQGWFLF